MKHGKYEAAPTPHGRRRLLSVALCAILAVCLTAGGTLAYYFLSTGAVQNTFHSGTVNIGVVESVQDNVKNSITVENTGSSPVYVRVRLVTYWADENGDPVAVSSPSLTVDHSAHWEARDGYYYYKYILPKDTATENLLDDGIPLRKEGEHRQVVEVLAEAVQASPKDAAQQLWGYVPGG